jgi:hypothetical protein
MPLLTGKRYHDNMPTKNRTISTVLTTSNQDIYTVPDRWNAEVFSIFITNTTTSPRTISMEWYDSVNSTWSYLMKDMPLVPNGIIQIEESIYLVATDKIRGLSNVNSSVTVTFKVLEDFATAL